MINAQKINVGETIKFTDYVVTQAFTRFGETSVVSFANEKGEIFRKVMSNSLGNYMRKNQPKNSVTLVKKLVDGEFTYNVFNHE